MAFESTMTEMEMDPNAQQMIQNLRSDGQSYEPDLDVEGMSPSILSRIIGLFSRNS